MTRAKKVKPVHKAPRDPLVPRVRKVPKVTKAHKVSRAPKATVDKKE